MEGDAAVFTLNYGLESFGSHSLPAVCKGRQTFTHFDQTLFNEGVHSTVYPNAGPAGPLRSFPATLNIRSETTPRGLKDQQVCAPFGSGMGSARRRQDDHPRLLRNVHGPCLHSGVHRFSQRTRRSANFNISLANVNLTNPWVNYPGGNHFPARTTGKNLVFGQSGTYLTSIFKFQPPYMNQWNLSVQRQIGSDWLVKRPNAISGNNSIHLQSAQQLNPDRVSGPGPVHPPERRHLFLHAAPQPANTNQRRVLLSLINPVQGAYYGPAGHSGRWRYGDLRWTLSLGPEKALSRGVQCTLQLNVVPMHKRLF